MPTSKAYGKKWTACFVGELYKKGLIRSILDIGPGRGTYSNLLRAQLPNVAWMGLDVWAPYIEEFRLREKYDRLVVADARFVDYSLIPADLAILGDILEHMTKEEAERVLERVLQCCRFALISIPIWETPQLEDYEGNMFEYHVKDDWTHEEVMGSFPSIRVWHTDQMLGVYVLGQERDKSLLEEAQRRAHASLEDLPENSPTIMLKKGGIYVPLRFVRRQLRLIALGFSKMFFSLYKRI